MPTHPFNPRVLTGHDLKAEMLAIGAEWAGVVRMLQKARHYVVRVDNVRIPAALILKEEMLAKGGDCAIHREAITHRVERSDCILIGTAKTFRRVLADLSAQPFELPRLAREIREAIDGYAGKTPVPPALSERLAAFYSNMQQRTLVMGVLNITPDSFSDGGSHAGVDKAVEHALRMVEDGVDVIDIGGESTRPGSDAVPAEEEMSRVLPVIEALASRVSVPISVDTKKPEVARAAVGAGANIVNDITALMDPQMLAFVAKARVPAIVMHMRGTPKDMQSDTAYEDVVAEVLLFLRERIAAAEAAGLPREYVIVDPGIGFAKTAAQNLEILRKLADFKSLGLPILIGTSRKAFVGRITGEETPAKRVHGTAATVALGIANGANIVRVHDVAEMLQVARMADAIVRSKNENP